MTNAGRKTILRWDRKDRTVHVYTADALEARRWRQLGYDVEDVGHTLEGMARGRRAAAPVGCVRLRRVKAASIVTRIDAGQHLAMHRRIPGPNVETGHAR
jgi:hypothetical protein